MYTKEDEINNITSSVNEVDENEAEKEEDVELLKEECLVSLKNETIIQYGNLLEINQWSVYRLNRALRALSEQNAAEGIPFLTSIIVSASSGEPSVGYWRGWSKLRDESVPYRRQHDRWLVELGKAIAFAKNNYKSK